MSALLFFILLGFIAIISASDCKVETVAVGDTCWSIATNKCGVSLDDFMKHNTQATGNICAALAVGQRVCCSTGSLPDIRPKQNHDGSCATYTTVKDVDTCSSIAAKNGLKVEDLSTFNDKTTWGWRGCGALQPDLKICVSAGSPPLPASQSIAVCGPTKPGTTAPTNGTRLADLNPCPLNACCNIWGQCGITPDFCTVADGPTSNPGTSPPGVNGCISNCGISVVNNAVPASTFRKVGYYESWNWDRDCLNMRADSIDDTHYTHIHWSFATITDNFDVAIDDSYNQLPRLRTLNVKKILSFGGWGYSTDPATYTMLRAAVDPQNVQLFTTNVVKYLMANDWDGVDVDWEYPGAPDIPHIPAGLPSDGPNYLNFLRILRSKMPSGKTISIAAPASYWYLKAFPIAEMAKVLDYIVYMTYDLHGTWDSGNKYSQDGCSNGNCLRSHVNLTETHYALAMITKAGVPANKITVGISSYGRSFKMTQADCTGPTCTFDGPADAGLCTESPGYISNAELYQLLALSDSRASTWYDKESESDIMVWDDRNWVAFMSVETRAWRFDHYASLNFGGIIDWAVDLLDFTLDDGDPNDQLIDPPGPAPPYVSCDNTYNSMEELDAAAGSIPQSCSAYYTVQALYNTLNNAVSQYQSIMSGGYDKKFKTYATMIAEQAGGTINDFMDHNGNKYFSCVVSEMTICCDECKRNQPADRPNYCAYCFDGPCHETCIGGVCPISQLTVRKLDSGETQRFFHGSVGQQSTPLAAAVPNAQPLVQTDDSQPQVQFNFTPRVLDRIPPQQALITKYHDVSEPCPPDYSQRGYGSVGPYFQNVHWSLNPDKSDQFYADLMTSTGIPKNKIRFGDVIREQHTDFNAPEPSGFAAGDVADPKAVVQKALDNSNNLLGQLQSALGDLRVHCYSSDPTELIDSVSLPVFMIADAVNGMASVEEVADKIDEEQRKAIILGFLGAILFLIPIAGEVLGSLTEFADTAAILTVVGAVGSSALDLYNIVDDPKNAAFSIFSLILEPFALLDLVKIREAAAIRRGMTDADVLKMGGKVAARMDTIKKVCGVCRKA